MSWPICATLTQGIDPVPEELVPILHVKDGQATARWYARLGFGIEGEHRFAPELPLYLSSR